MNNIFSAKINYKIYFFIILFFISKITISLSDNIKSVEIYGNERLSKETIILFSELQIDKDINVNDLNLSIKKLYQTDYFENIKMSIENNILKIDVVENPIIQTISINGINNKSILDKLNEITKKSEKYPFLIHKINDQKNLLINIVRTNGFYFATIDTKIKDNKNNSVDLIYDFDLGKRAKIQKINFIGKKIFKDNKLRSIIVSEENKPWKFITSNKYLDQNRIEYNELGYLFIAEKINDLKNIKEKYL